MVTTKIRESFEQRCSLSTPKKGIAILSKSDLVKQGRMTRAPLNRALRSDSLRATYGPQFRNWTLTFKKISLEHVKWALTLSEGADHTTPALIIEKMDGSYLE